MRTLSLTALLIALVGCGSPDAPRLETAADSLAFRVTEAAGGLDTWEALPGIAFEWAFVRDSVEVVRNWHVWDKTGDRVRSEFQIGADSVVVAVFSPSAFDPEAPVGQAALNGTVLAGEIATEQLAGAQSRFINDSYWLLAPLKVFDPGVVRAVETRDHVVGLALSFEGVGLTPGDRYWLAVDDGSGATTGWAFVLESGNEGDFVWLDPIDLDTPLGPLSFATEKASRAGGSAILTEPEALLEIDESLFTDLTPRNRPALR